MKRCALQTIRPVTSRKSVVSRSVRSGLGRAAASRSPFFSGSPRLAPASHTCTLEAGRAFFTAAEKIPASEKERRQRPDSQPGTERAKKKTARKNGRSFGNVLYLRAQRSVQGSIPGLWGRFSGRNPSELRGLCRTCVRLKRQPDWS